MARLVPALPLSLLLFVSVLTLASASAAQQPSGMLIFSGAGVSLLPSSTFVPEIYEGDDEAWGFLSETDSLSLIIIRHNTDPKLAAFATLAVLDGPTWFTFGLFGIPGIAIDGNTISFTNVVLPQTAKQADVMINGTLTRPPVVAVQPLPWSQVKLLFQRH